MIIQTNMMIYAHVKSASIVSCTVDLSLDFLTALILQTHVLALLRYTAFCVCTKHKKMVALIPDGTIALNTTHAP